MGAPRVIILRAAGVNCEQETAHAWQLAGAASDIVHINELRETPRRLLAYQILTVPGGFSYGDDIAAGKIFANQLLVSLGDRLQEFHALGRLILGICNGFQVLCRAGLLPGSSAQCTLPRCTVTQNVSGKYEDRWVLLERGSDNCAFLRTRIHYELPVAHGEGRVMARSIADMERLRELGCVGLRYRARDGNAVEYPDDPNGSMLHVAGLCDVSGRVLGLMPHPERFVHPTQHPEWTSRSEVQADGRELFESAVEFWQ